MSEASTKPAAQVSAVTASTTPPSVLQIFLEFLIIGATSFGGGVVAYLRNGLVTKRGWLDDKGFVELLAISQSLPGLNSTNMAILVGDRLRGIAGSIAGIVGMCLPGGLFMYVVGMVYRQHGDHPLATAALKGVAAAAVGLILATAVQLGKKSLDHRADPLFVVITVLAVNRLHQSVLTALVAVGLIATLYYRPGVVRPKSEESHT
jgi:chromate transporter